MNGLWWVIILVLLAAGGIAVAVGRRKSRSGGTAMEVYIDGLRSMIAGDQKNAFVKLRQAVDLDTENIDAYLKLGDLFRETGLVDKALQIHRELTLRREVSSDLRAEIDQSLVADYIEAGLNAKAEEILRRMIKNSERRKWAEDRLLDIYLRDGNWPDAEELYRGIMKSRGMKQSPTMAQIKLMIGRNLQREKQYHKARVIYKEALSLNERDPFPYLYVAESYLQEDRVNDGLEFLKKLCETVPHHASLGFSMIEETLFNLGRFSEVEDIYRGVLSKLPGDVAATVALAGILEKKGEIPTAENMLRSVLNSGSSSDSAAIKLAKLLAASDRREESLAILSEMADKTETDQHSFRCDKCGKNIKTPLPYCADCGSLGSYI
ncbi:MAG: tetratricopeptide repeat protein [candidate division Zixibacteria bacterium]